MQLARSFVVIATLLAARTASAGITAVTGFGTNPGALAMYEYVPAGLASGRPLVVVLHGCTQTANDMVAAGWNTLADQYGFAVVYPEQQTANNSARCFNWGGEYGDLANLQRGMGENLSIIQMVDKMIAAHGSDTSHVYITGFSAGAAFTSVMMATYPDRFAAAAINSGIVYHCATSVASSFTCMSPGVSKTGPQWGDLVRSSHAGPYPRVQIWQGASDTTIAPMNQGELVKQWTDALGIDATVDEMESIGANGKRAAYKDASGKIAIETYTIAGMPHAVSIGAEGSTACPATAGQYFSDKGVCSTLRAAQFFGLTGTTPTSGGDTTAPTVAITAPVNGATVTSNVTIAVDATDDVGVASVTLSIDGAEVGAPSTTAPYTFPWDAAAAGAGDHAVVAVARDAAGNAATAMVTLTVGDDGTLTTGTGATGDDDGAGTPPGASDALPGCSLDAGGGHGGMATLGLALAALLSARGRTRRS